MLMRTDPFRELDRLTQQVFGTSARPAVDADGRLAGRRQFLVEFDLPGVDPDSIDLDVERNVLTVRAERPVRESASEMVAAERPRGVFSRQLILGDNLDLDQISAGYRDGVLTLPIPGGGAGQAAQDQHRPERGRWPDDRGQFRPALGRGLVEAARCFRLSDLLVWPAVPGRRPHTCQRLVGSPRLPAAAELAPSARVALILSKALSMDSRVMSAAESPSSPASGVDDARLEAPQAAVRHVRGALSTADLVRAAALPQATDAFEEYRVAAGGVEDGEQCLVVVEGGDDVAVVDGALELGRTAAACARSRRR